MSENLFQNVISTHARPDRLREILVHPENLPLWDEEIIQVVPTVATEFQLTRQPPALNEHEDLSVTATADQIIYHSQGGRLAYDLVFSLATEATTILTEELRVTSTGGLPLPLRLLAPIAQQAFAQKLHHLIALAESSREVLS
ncbi:SRPBCC family protein [Levilactobacillus wangkuiensis]|uniref:SRPBCC family protein n=1 Tax=Levilactobacillus wangkuiensis TaxID=2799566 RepID=UPI0019412588|nr:SRPBCC family protein [Levilactobacillus wangkuiensis]